MELMLNFGQIFIYLPYLITHFVKRPGYNIDLLSEIQNYSFPIYLPIFYSFVLVPTMLMDFLWLAYRKYEYKYTMIRWTWYIVIRIVFVFLVWYSNTFIFIPHNYRTIYLDIVSIFDGILPIIDFIQFVYYARKFYFHLKSREKEI